MVDCSNVYVKKSTVCDGFGAFSKNAIQKDEIIETGIARILTNCDGNENPVVFTWSDDVPNTTWAVCSGCAMFYNTSYIPNTYMVRDFDKNTFVIRASCDIESDTELFHKYKSIEWRSCFNPLKKKIEKKIT